MTSNNPYDERIKQSIENQLYWNPQLNESEVHVMVTDGDVELAGTVPSEDARNMIETAVEKADGVLSIKNKLTIWQSGDTKTHTDDDLRQDIEKVLHWNPELDGATIEVSVAEGRVTLRGTVDSVWKNQRVEKLVAGIIGVTEIDNKIAIVPGKKPPKVIA